eukprot:2145403-Ditylum_brightwellii.AAC.1
MDLKPAAVMDNVAGVDDGEEEGVMVSDDSSDGVTELCYTTPELVRTFNSGVQEWEGKQPAPPLPYKEVVKTEPQNAVATLLDGNINNDTQSSPVASAQKTQSYPVASAQKRQLSPVASVNLSPVASAQKSLHAGNSNWHRVSKTSSKFLEKQKDHTCFICPEENCTYPFHVHDEILPFLPHNEHNDIDYSQRWNCSCIKQNVQDKAQ